MSFGIADYIFIASFDEWDKDHDEMLQKVTTDMSASKFENLIKVNIYLDVQASPSSVR